MSTVSSALRILSKSSDSEHLSQRLADKQTKRADLAQRLSAASAVVAEQQATMTSMALEADDASIDAAARKLAVADSKKRALEAALKVIDQEIQAAHDRARRSCRRGTAAGHCRSALCACREV